MVFDPAASLGEVKTRSLLLCLGLSTRSYQREFEEYKPTIWVASENARLGNPQFQIYDCPPSGAYIHQLKMSEQIEVGSYTVGVVEQRFYFQIDPNTLQFSIHPHTYENTGAYRVLPAQGKNLFIHSTKSLDEFLLMQGVDVSQPLVQPPKRRFSFIYSS